MTPEDIRNTSDDKAAGVVVVVVGIMVVATHVHLVVDDPTLSPLQPSEPVIPLIVLLMSAYIVWRGAGTWSADLRAMASHSTTFS